MSVSTRYRNIQEVGVGGGCQDTVALLTSAGLPLELIHIFHDRVFHIEAFDYVEGVETPLECLHHYWYEVFEQITLVGYPRWFDRCGPVCDTSLHMGT